MKIIYQELMRTGHWKDIDQKKYNQLDSRCRRTVFPASVKPDGYFKDHLLSCHIKASREERSGYVPFIIIGPEV